jgi:hypothetical protein
VAWGVVMRKWMILATVMLAVFQLWPMVFGHNSNSEAAASMPAAHLVAAVASSSATPIKVAAIKPAGPPQSCYVHYRAAYTACAVGDRVCHTHAADAWDLCEATGSWAN